MSIENIKIEKLSIEELKELQCKIKEQIIAKKQDEALKHYQILEFDFLYRSIFYDTSKNNQKRCFKYSTILLSTPEVRNIAEKYKIYSENDIRHLFYPITPPFRDDRTQNEKDFMSNLTIQKRIKEATTLFGLKLFFQEEKNIFDYEGTYILYTYIENTIRRCIEENIDIDSIEDSLYKDFSKKYEIVANNLGPIVKELFDERNKLQYARFAYDNRGLTRTSRKKNNTTLTYDQKILAHCLALGPTIEELKKQDYTKMKQLIYIPHKKEYK